MKLSIAKRVNKDEWNSLIEEFDGNLYHSYQWGEIHRTTKTYPLYFKYKDKNGKCLGLALGIISKPRLKYIGEFFKKIDFNTLPIILKNDEALFQNMLNEIFSFCSKNRLLSFRIDSYYSRVNLESLKKHKINPIPRIEFIVDLKKSEEDLWNSIKPAHRKKIKKGLDNQLQFIDENSSEALVELRSFQIDSRNRKIEQGDYYEIGKAEDYIKMKEDLLDKNIGKLFFVKNCDETLSAAFFTIFNQKVFYLAGGTSLKGFEVTAPFFLFWNAILYFKKEGFAEFNFGGVPREAENPLSKSFGLYRFKNGFGGEKVNCCGWENPELGRFKNILLKILKKVGSFRLFIIEKYIALRKDLSLPDPGINFSIDLEIREAKKEEIETFKNMPPPFPRHYEYYKIHGLKHCYLSLCEKRIVFIGWIQYPEEFVSFVLKLRKLKPHETEINHVFTLEGYRGKNIFPKVLDTLCKKLRNDGFKHVYAFVLQENASSIKGLRKAGFNQVGKVTYIKMFWNKRGNGFYFRRIKE